MPQGAESARRSREPSPRILAFVAVSLKLAAAIRQALPVEGQPWPKAGEPEEQVMAPVAELLPGFAECWMVRNAQGYRPLAEGWQTLDPPPEDPEALLALIRCWQRVFEHYGWGEIGVRSLQWVGGALQVRYGWVEVVPWHWPDIPRIPPEVLDDVERAARALMPQGLAQPAQDATPPPGGGDRAAVESGNGQADRPINLRDYAIGLEDGRKWHLFRLIKHEWRPLRALQGIAKGKQQSLLEALARQEGILSRVDAVNLGGKAITGELAKKRWEIIKSEMSNIRQRIRNALKITGKRVDPIPWSEGGSGWHALIQIGYAVQEDGEQTGGESRLRFKMRSELSRDERADR
jgi:hypothetical protein